MPSLLAFQPFVQPAPLWDYWYLLALPIIAALSIVYKSIRCHEMKQVPREAAVIFVTILAGMVIAAGVLWVIVKVAV